MDKRGVRYQQAERTNNAEQRAKALKLENADLRKQLFRAQESARLANEEANARELAQRQSAKDLRERIDQAKREAEWSKTEAAIERNLREKLAAMSVWRIAAQRLVARFGSTA